MATVDSPRSIEGIKVIDSYDVIAEELIKGNEVYHWETGDSMFPILKDREYCLITPVRNIDLIKVGDPVFARMVEPNGTEYFMVHMVTLISDRGADGKKWFQIGSTSGDIFGWTSDILGLAKGTNIFQKGETEEGGWWKILPHLVH